jgi:hypothetical protein
MNGREFVDYVLSFYGVGGLYDYKFTKEEVETATLMHFEKVKSDFVGDSFDREYVRDIVLDDIRA